MRQVWIGCGLTELYSVRLRASFSCSASKHPKPEYVLALKRSECWTCCQGVVKRGPSVEYMQKVSSLSMYNNMLGGDDMSDCLTDCLRAPGCSDAVIGLREASVKALATVQDMTCAEESLQEEVEAVHKALGRALRLSAEKGTGKREYKRFSKEEHVGADSMLDYNERSFPFFICMNAMSILIISEAATRALEMGSLKDGEPQYKRSYRSESDSDPDSI